MFSSSGRKFLPRSYHVTMNFILNILNFQILLFIFKTVGGRGFAGGLMTYLNQFKGQLK